MFPHGTELQPWQLLLAVVAAVAGVTSLIRGTLRDRTKDLIEQLADPEDRKHWIDQLSRSTPARMRYSLTLLRLNSYVSRVYSTSFSLQAFDRSLLFTLIYPFTLYLIAWSFGGSNKIGNLVFLGSHAEGAERWFVILLYIALAILAATLFSLLPRSERLFVFDRMAIIVSFKLRDWAQLISVVGGLLFVWYISQLLTSVGYAVSLAVFYLYSIALYLAWRTLFSKQPAAAPVLTGTLFLGFVFTFFSVWLLGVGTGTLAFLALFFALLPLVNAVFDYASWAVTRWFLRLAAKGAWATHRVPSLLAGLIADVAWAALCLIALAASILAVYAFFDYVFPSQSVQWRTQLRLFREASSATSMLIIGMLVSTLIPTVIHIFVGVAGTVIAYLPQSDRAVQLLSGPTLSTRKLQEAARFIKWLRLCVFVLPVILAILACSLPYVVGPFIQGPVHSILLYLIRASDA